VSAPSWSLDLLSAVLANLEWRARVVTSVMGIHIVAEDL
jgi:hypothetical protein